MHPDQYADVALAPHRTKSPDRPYSVVIADPNLMIAQAISAILSGVDDFSAKGVDSLDAALAVAREDQVDLFLYDCSVPGCFGMDGVSSLVTLFPETALVLFGTCNDYAFLTAALRAGIRGYVPKSMPLRSLRPTIDLLRAGETYVPAHVFRALKTQRVQAAETVKLLTAEETSMVRLIERGASNKEIGDAHKTTENRIKMKLRKVFVKLGAANRSHAVRIAKDLGEI